MPRSRIPGRGLTVRTWLAVSLVLAALWLVLLLQTTTSWGIELPLAGRIVTVLLSVLAVAIFLAAGRPHRRRLTVGQLARELFGSGVPMALIAAAGILGMVGYGIAYIDQSPRDRCMSAVRQGLRDRGEPVDNTDVGERCDALIPPLVVP